ncbi:MAG: sugar ABC transporter substrate-binding protein [Actinomyces sp.]|uniref:ABC transporter substrate-binding protein n=1 Tax=Actinomyces sp. TaxID=29317 RepID=UPI0026DCFFA2|nr:sugar ABC transporter substrate-binding protein [Actinomyces sp.]MDO4242373.1 sugar ABC transporter substrate-binding protein [Actinomyces sp.]
MSRRTLLSGSALLALSIAGCSGSSGAKGQGTVTWSTWGSPEELTLLEEFNTQFMKNNPDITVVFQPVASYEEYHTKLLTQLTSGTAPDVFYIGDDRVASVLPHQVLAPLDDYLAGSDSPISTQDFNAEVYGIAELDGSLYALPNDVNPDAWWYNKNVLEAAGITEDPAQLAEQGAWTTSAFLSMSEKIKAAGLTTLAFWNYWATHASWITSQGGRVYDDSDSYVAHTDPASVAAVTELAARCRSGEFVVADTLPEGSGADAMFLTDKLAFFAQGRYTANTLRSAGVDLSAYDIAPWPTPEGTAAPTGLAASFLAINAKAADPQAAYTFFSSFLSVEGQRIRLASGTAVPSVKGADDLVTNDDFPAHAQTMLDMRDAGYTNNRAEASVPGLSSTIATDHMLPLYQGKAQPQETLDAIAALIAQERTTASTSPSPAASAQESQS